MFIDVPDQTDVDESVVDVADVVFAAAARAFFATVLDALGVQADAQLAGTFDLDLRGQLTVGRPFAAEKRRADGRAHPPQPVDGLPDRAYRPAGV